MPAVTQEQFQRVLQMQIEKSKEAIITQNARLPIVTRRYPNGVGFDNDQYMAALAEIYTDPDDIPDVFMNPLRPVPLVRISDLNFFSATPLAETIQDDIQNQLSNQRNQAFAACLDNCHAPTSLVL